MRSDRRAQRILACLLGLAAVLVGDRRAAGLYLADRGVRPLGRGGAFVAGADDLGAIWYNPAGLADAGSSLLVDFSWLNFSSEWTRRTNVTDAGGTIHTLTFPTVDGMSPFLPIPTIAGSFNFGANKEFTLATGIYAPYVAIANYPLVLDGQPSPSRYSLVSLAGSALVIAGGYFAYKPVEAFRIGIGLQALVGKDQTTVVFSSSPADRVIGPPEDPQYDSLSKLDIGPIVAPSGNFGMIVVPAKILRLGLSAQLPFWINAPAHISVNLPTAAPFDNAKQVGDEAQVRFRLPPIIRAGIELRPNIGEDRDLRVEIAYVREFWSFHDSIDVASKNIQLYNVTGFPSPFGVAPISLPRHFQDSNSFRIGGEASFKVSGTQLDFRAGFSYETSGIPPEWVSVLTYDAAKMIPSIGGSIHLGDHWRFDGVAALDLLNSTTVDPADAKIPRVNPVRGNATAAETINGGDYSAHALILGIGLNYRFDVDPSVHWRGRNRASAQLQ